MRVMGINFTKINVEKKSDDFSNVKLESRINFEEVKSIKSDVLNSPDEIVVVRAKYSLKYAPDAAEIEMILNVLLSLEPETAKKTLKEWKESKKIPEDVRFYLNNLILRKTTLKSLELEDELNIPLHIPMPSLKKKEEKDKINSA